MPLFFCHSSDVSSFVCRRSAIAAITITNSSEQQQSQPNAFLTVTVIVVARSRSLYFLYFFPSRLLVNAASKPDYSTSHGIDEPQSSCILPGVVVLLLMYCCCSAIISKKIIPKIHRRQRRGQIGGTDSSVVQYLKAVGSNPPHFGQLVRTVV